MSSIKEQFIQQSKGKTIAGAEWDEVENYWVLTFTDGSEVCIRLMAEIAMERRAQPFPNNCNLGPGEGAA